MAVYGRVGQRVVIQRLATLADVQKLDNRKPDKRDRERIKQHCLVVVTDTMLQAETGGDALRLYDIAFLRADDGAREIGAIVDACAANGGRAP